MNKPPLKLEQNLPFFEPEKRHAILFNNYDIYAEYQQFQPHSRGNRRVYALEALLTGTFEYLPEAKEIQEELLNSFFDEEIQYHKKYRGDIKYNSVTRIFPKSQMRKNLEETIDRIVADSDEKTLTFVYITSHGEEGEVEGGFVIDNTKEIKYTELLQMLDKIKGKKAIVLFACYSGTFFNALENHKSKEDYTAIVSTKEDEQGLNWNEDELQALIERKLIYKAKLSEIQLPYEINKAHSQHPSIKGYFDTVL